MNFIILSILLLWVPVQHSTAPAAPSHLPFYRITKPGTQDTSYLFGTLHLLEGGYVDTMPRLMKALRQADVVVGELALDSAMTGDALQGLLSGPPLDSLLTDSQYHLVSRAVKEYSEAPMMLLNNAEPIVLYSLIMEGMYEKHHPENHKTGVPMDLFFEQEAQQNGKPVIGLERMDDQEQLLDSIPVKEQVNDLLDLVQHGDSAMMQMDTMLDEYRAGKITEILDDPSFGSFSPEEMTSLLYDRNKKWLDELPAILAHKRAFIAVGAGHLAGEKGLVEGLRKRGYLVDKISPL